MLKRVSRASTVVARLAILACLPGGLLWMLSPLGVRLSEMRYNTPNVFWKLFPSAPLLLVVGLIGLHLSLYDRYGRVGRAGAAATLLGLALVIAGDVAQFWLMLDDVYILTAPAYRTFRIGLVVLAIGSIVFGMALLRSRALPDWGTLPFITGSVGALLSFARDLGTTGAVLWVMYGACWAWLGLVYLVEILVALWRRRGAGA